MASFIKKIFGSSSKESKVKKETPPAESNAKKETNSKKLKFNNDPIIPIPESQESIQYWEKEIDRIIPKDIINRGVIEAAFNGMPFHKGLLGLAFLPFSNEHALTWLRKAAEQNHVYAKNSLDILEKEDSDRFVIIWWGEKDFTNIIHSNIKIHTLNRATDASLNKSVIRNVTLIPNFEEVLMSNRNRDYFDFIRDNIDDTIVPNSDVIYKWFKKGESLESEDNTVLDENSNEFFTEDELYELFGDRDNDDEAFKDNNDDALLDEIFQDIDEAQDSKSKSTEKSNLGAFKQKLAKINEKGKS